VTLRIEDYGIIGDTHTAGLVGCDGSIDWLCLPRFDSDACFAKLLGGDTHGFWRIAPVTDAYQARRRYRGDTLVLETEFETADGVAKVVDCMPIRESHPQVVRMVEAVRGEVAMRMDLVIRFGYGSMVPWVRRVDGLLSAIAGPDALALWTPIETRGQDMTTVAEFTVSATEHIPFVLTWYPSHEAPPRPVDASCAHRPGSRAATWWRRPRSPRWVDR